MKNYKELISFKDEESQELPKVEVRTITVGDHLKSIEIAKKEFGNAENVEQIAFCKIAQVCKFNDEVWSVEKIKFLPLNFINDIMNAIAEEDEGK